MKKKVERCEECPSFYDCDLKDRKQCEEAVEEVKRRMRLTSTAAR